VEKYYVNKVAQNNGDHEVHKSKCNYLPSAEHRLYLGMFDNCRDAVNEAKKFYKQCNGCFYCCRECHTG